MGRPRRRLALAPFGSSSAGIGSNEACRPLWVAIARRRSDADQQGSPFPILAADIQYLQEKAEGASSLDYRRAVNGAGSPSSTVADTYSWTPGTELMRADVEAA